MPERADEMSLMAWSTLTRSAVACAVLYVAGAAYVQAPAANVPVPTIASDVRSVPVEPPAALVQAPAPLSEPAPPPMFFESTLDLLRSSAMMSPPLAPTWKLLLYEPLSRLVAPNFVWPEMLSSCLLSATTSELIAFSEDASWVPVLPACTIRVRMRWRMFWVVPRAPSAIWATLMPS